MLEHSPGCPLRCEACGFYGCTKGVHAEVWGKIEAGWQAGGHGFVSRTPLLRILGDFMHAYHGAQRHKACHCSTGAACLVSPHQTHPCAGDTRPCPALISAGADATLLLHAYLGAAKTISNTHAGATACGCTHPCTGDTRPCPALISAGAGATLLIHEATFEGSMLAHAQAKAHSTLQEALEVADQMGAYRWGQEARQLLEWIGKMLYSVKLRFNC